MLRAQFPTIYVTEMAGHMGCVRLETARKLKYNLQICQRSTVKEKQLNAEIKRINSKLEHREGHGVTVELHD